MSKLILGWSLVGDKKECGGSEKSKGRMDSIEECAEACTGVSTMFAFGTNDYGTNRCKSKNKGCKCLCETSAGDDGTCNMVNHKGYRLYKFGTSGKH